MARVFTRRLVRQVPVDTSDGSGGRRRHWEERGALWAEVKMRSGALKQTEFGQTPRLQVRITTYLVPQEHETRPEVGQRLRDGARLFAIEAVHDGDGRYLTILASEVHGSEVGR